MLLTAKFSGLGIRTLTVLWTHVLPSTHHNHISQSSCALDGETWQQRLAYGRTTFQFRMGHCVQHKCVIPVSHTKPPTLHACLVCRRPALAWCMTHSLALGRLHSQCMLHLKDTAMRRHIPGCAMMPMISHRHLLFIGSLRSLQTRQGNVTYRPHVLVLSMQVATAVSVVEAAACASSLPHVCKRTPLYIRLGRSTRCFRFGS